MIEIANQAIDTVYKITRLREKDMAKLQSLGKRAAESAIMILPKLYGQPIVTTNIIANWANFTRQGALKVINRFIELGILEPKNEDKKYGQSFVYKEYIDIFTE